MSNQSYDPFKLLGDLKGLLQERGLQPEPVDGVDRVRLASDLLRAYGIEPAVQPESVLDLDGHERYNRRLGEDR
jgi:hypothetical protein